MKILRTKLLLTASVCGVLFLPADLNAQTSAQQFTVVPVAAENGTYSIEPALPEDGKVAAGTVFTLKATPAADYALDAVYYTIKGGMWGTTNHESFSPKMKITVNSDMKVGATFIPQSLVNGIEVTPNVVYAKPGIKPLKYDVYAPKGAKNLPCIVIIHGGGWASNNEDIMRGLALELVKGGRYVVFSIDYRWINKLDGEAQPVYMHNLIEDVFGAIAHIQQYAAKYGADGSRMGVTGDSAGGHLAEAAATLSPMIGDKGFGLTDGIYNYMPSYLPKGKTVAAVRMQIVSAIKAVAPSYGVSEAADFGGLIQQKDKGYWDAISPARHVPNAAERQLPHFLVRGTKDPIVSNAMVQHYVDALNSAGQKAEYIQVEGAGHAFFDWKPDATTRATFHQYGVPYAAKMLSFFDGVFYKN